jgi:hypothetical protein
MNVTFLTLAFNSEGCRCILSREMLKNVLKIVPLPRVCVGVISLLAYDKWFFKSGQPVKQDVRVV